MKKKKKNINGVLVGMILGLIIVGYFIYIDYFDGKPISNTENISLKNVAIACVLFLVFTMVHIIIHELGHLIFGLATGYSFMSFRIGSFTIIKEEGKFKIKKYNIPGTAGQCLMMPPDLKDGKYPFVLYNLGGVLLNTVVSVISILFVLINNIKYPASVILTIFSVAGLFLALTNGIPLKVSGITNDAYNVKLMIKDKESKMSFYTQLKVIGLLSKGIRFRDMDFNLFQLKETSDVANPLNTNIRLMEYSFYIDNMNFENAKICLDSLVPYLQDILPLYVNEINCERIFLELIGDCDKSFIDSLYDMQLEQYIKKSKYMVSKIRFLMAYETFYNGDKEKALVYYQKLKELCNSYPIKGEADMELMIADWIKDT